MPYNILITEHHLIFFFLVYIVPKISVLSTETYAGFDAWSGCRIHDGSVCVEFADTGHREDQRALQRFCVGASKCWFLLGVRVRFRCGQAHTTADR